MRIRHHIMINKFDLGLSCGETIVKIYPKVFLEFDFKLTVVFLFCIQYIFPRNLDSGLAQLSNRCRRCPIDISLDIGIWLYSDVNVLLSKK